MDRISVYQQVEGEAGFARLGTVENDVYAELIAPRFGLKPDEVLYTVTRKIDGELAWLIKTKSPDPITRTKMQRFDDLATICSFLGWQERESADATWGGRKISEVLDAWCRVSGLTRVQIDRVLDESGEETKQ